MTETNEIVPNADKCIACTCIEGGSIVGKYGVYCPTLVVAPWWSTVMRSVAPAVGLSV